MVAREEVWEPFGEFMIVRIDLIEYVWCGGEMWECVSSQALLMSKESSKDFYWDIPINIIQWMRNNGELDEIEAFGKVKSLRNHTYCLKDDEILSRYM